MTNAVPGTLPALVSDEQARSELLSAIRSTSGGVLSAALLAMEDDPWFAGLDAESRSWIAVLARAGIDGFLTWTAGEPFDAESVFYAAPRALAGRISLQQTVRLVRMTTDIMEQHVAGLVDGPERMLVQLSCLHYSRDIAFAAANIYAKAAEQRGAWDSRIEAAVVDAVVRFETDEAVLSRASTLGWDPEAPVAVAIGRAPEVSRIERLRRGARKQGLEVLAAIQGDRLVCIISGPALAEDLGAVRLVDKLADHFADGPVVVGPVVETLAGAPLSARAAASGYRAAPAWPEGPRTLLSVDLLPERTLAGDEHARTHVVEEVFLRLSRSPELLETCVAFLDSGSSVEATARALFVHPNTVRYRTKRIQDATGYNPTDPREAYVLRLAITLGRLTETTEA